MTLVLGSMMVGLGWLATHPLARQWPFSVEDGVDRTLAAHRSSGLNAFTGGLSTIADTPTTVLIAIGAILCARWAYRRWREALFIVMALTIEVTVFLTTTVLVHRSRPAVVHLDQSPPTSSFPSGHTAAALALYGAIAWLIVRRTGRGYAWILLLMPLAVGLSRLYRGMHHPSDVVAGLLLGACALLIAGHGVLDVVGPRSQPRARLQRARTAVRTTPARQRHVAAPGGRR